MPLYTDPLKQSFPRPIGLADYSPDMLSSLELSPATTWTIVAIALAATLIILFALIKKSRRDILRRGFFAGILMACVAAYLILAGVRARASAQVLNYAALQAENQYFAAYEAHADNADWLGALAQNVVMERLGYLFAANLHDFAALCAIAAPLLAIGIALIISIYLPAPQSIKR